METVINKFLKDNNLYSKVNWVKEQICKEDKNFLAQYKIDKDCIVMYEMAIKNEYHLNFARRCSYDEFYKIIFCHELGHKLDNHLKASDEIILEAQLIIQAYHRKEDITIYGTDYNTEKEKVYNEKSKKEERAYNIGKEYINDEMQDLFYEIQQTKLQSIK